MQHVPLQRCRDARSPPTSPASMLPPALRPLPLQLEILGVKKNPNGQAYTGLGVVTKGESN